MKPNILLRDRPVIYAIRNTVNGKVYVGRTKCIYKRCIQYRYDFRNRTIGHLNEHLFNAMTKYSIENFEMFPLEFCDLSEAKECELKWMDTIKSYDRNFGYNLRRDAEGGMIAHEETRIKLRNATKGQWETGVRSREKYSEIQKKIWENDHERKRVTGVFLSSVLTKWVYDIYEPSGEVRTVKYAELKLLGYHRVMLAFYRKGDDVFHKGVRIVRRRIDPCLE